MVALARPYQPRRAGPSLNRQLREDVAVAFIPGLSLGRAIPHEAGQLDIVRCPLCRGPLIVRVDRRGPYFHCLCPPRP